MADKKDPGEILKSAGVTSGPSVKNSAVVVPSVKDASPTIAEAAAKDVHISTAEELAKIDPIAAGSIFTQQRSDRAKRVEEYTKADNSEVGNKDGKVQPAERKYLQDAEKAAAAINKGIQEMDGSKSYKTPVKGNERGF